MARTLDEGFTSEELVAAKAALLDERIGARSSDRGVLNLISSRERWSRTLAWDSQLDAQLAGLTLEQVNAAFRRHIDPEAISVVKGGDFGEGGQ